MALLKKKTDTTSIPELQEYYASRKKDNTALAWLLAFGSLVVTAGILVGLFLGGRWLYRTITKDDNTVSVTTTTSTPTTAINQTSEESSSNTTSPATGNPAPQSTATGSATDLINGMVPAPGVSPSQTAEQNRSAVAATTTLPNSGPGQLVLLFVISTIIGSLSYRSVLLKKNR